MSPRGLAVLVVVLVAAVAAVLWLQPAGDRDDAAVAALLLDLPLDDVSRIVIEGSSETIVLARGTAGWTLGEAPAQEADPGEVEGLLQAIRSARVARVVEERGAELATFGLEPPARRVLLTVAGRPAPVELRLGRPSPVAWQRYVLRDDRSVVLAEGSLGTALERTAASFRELRLFPMATARLRRVEIADPLRRVVVERRGEQWWIEAPYVDRADTDLAEAIARTAASIRFASLEPESGRGIGPAHRVTVWGEGEPTERSAEIGLPATDGMRLARRFPGRIQGRVPDDAAREFEGDPEALRERRLAAFLASEVREIAWTIGEEDWIARRETESDPYDLRRRAEEAGRAADPQKIARLLDGIRALQLSAPRAPFARGAPTAKIAVAGDSGEIAAIAFGPIAGGGTWAESTWRPGIVGTVDPVGFASLLAAARETAP